MTYRTSLPLHPTEDDKPKTKRQEKKILKAKAKATGTPYQKPTRTKKGLPGDAAIKTARRMVTSSIATGMGGSILQIFRDKRTGPPLVAAATQAVAGTVLGKLGFKRKEAARNQPTAKPVTKKNTRKNIKKTRHVTPTGVTRTKTKTYKKR